MPREAVLPVIVLVVLFVALLIGYPWWVLTIGTLFYLSALPFGVLSYRRLEREEAAKAPAPPAATAAPAEAVGEAPPPAPSEPSRPVRLN